MHDKFLLSVMRNQVVIEGEKKCFKIPRAIVLDNLFCFDLLDRDSDGTFIHPSAMQYLSPLCASTAMASKIGIGGAVAVDVSLEKLGT